jgi:hypothetical protein
VGWCRVHVKGARDRESGGLQDEWVR